MTDKSRQRNPLYGAEHIITAGHRTNVRRYTNGDRSINTKSDKWLDESARWTHSIIFNFIIIANKKIQYQELNLILIWMQILEKQNDRMIEPGLNIGRYY